MKAQAVIGANFGDEGKGRTVDELSSPGTMVVRFNGGSQAGHTVEHAGKRHVFSHVGSGTFAGATTVLSRFFVADPITFAHELRELDGLAYPNVIIDPRCPVTTPYEVAVNKALERSRGDARHGSCGVGFGETLEREERGVSLLAGNPRPRLEGVREHALRRVEELGLSKDVVEAVSTEEISFWYDCWELLQLRAQCKDTRDAVKHADHVVFEGAQGLLLDAKSKYFPHVTRSRTGLHNVRILAAECGISHVEALYVTRSYLTRHGAGPLPGEDPTLAYPDKTNQPAEFQGSLRFAALDLAELRWNVYTDVYGTPSTVSVVPSLAVTCLDQYGGLIWAHNIEDYLMLPVDYAAFGPARGQMVDRRKKVAATNHLFSCLSASM